MSGSLWSEELIDKLKELYYSEKYSTKEIGEIMGFSKNAIVGKVHRLGLNLEIKKNKPIQNNTNKTVVVNKRGKYTMNQITQGMCVWPYGVNKITFCGDPSITGRSYCEEHFEKAYIKLNRKTKKI